MPSLCPVPPALTPTNQEEMRAVTLPSRCYFCEDEHHQDACACFANSLAAYSMVQGDAQRKAGAASAAPADGSSFELALVGKRKDKTHYMASVGCFYRKTSPI